MPHLRHHPVIYREYAEGINRIPSHGWGPFKVKQLQEPVGAWGMIHGPTSECKGSAKESFLAVKGEWENREVAYLTGSKDSQLLSCWPCSKTDTARTQRQ